MPFSALGLSPKLCAAAHAAGFVGTTPVQSAAPRLHDPHGTGGIKGKRPSKKDKLRAAAATAKVPDKPF